MASQTIFALAILYLFLFGALGAELPYLPYFLANTGLSAAQIGVILTAGTVTQVVVAPMFGCAADRYGARLILAISAVAAAASILLFLAAPEGIRHALLVYVLFAMSTAALNPLADALSVPACQRAGIPYGRVRGMGSVGFFAGVLGSSVVTARLGISSIILMAAILFGLMALTVPALPVAAEPMTRNKVTGGVWTLITNTQFRRVLLIAALVLGGHAMSDAFAVVHWTEIGFGTQAIGVLIALGVGSEFLVFVLIGPMLLARLGPAACASLGAVAGIIRWAVLAESQSMLLLLPTQLLHGLTFSLVHLACMQVLAIVAPRRFFATAQSLYGICSNAVASAAITLAAGMMFSSLHAHAFWLASALCGVALPIALRLSASPYDEGDGQSETPEMQSKPILKMHAPSEQPSNGCG